RPKPPQPAQRTQGDEEPDHDRGRERDDRQLERGQRSPPVRTGGERRPEEVGVEAREHELQVVLADVAGWYLVLRSVSSGRAVRLQLRDARLELCTERIALAVVDAEGVLVWKRVR